MTTPATSDEDDDGDVGTDVDGDGLHAHLVVQRDQFRLDVQVHAQPGEVLALLGPNGAGKTTALRALAGLTTLTSGHVHLDRELLEDPVRRRRIPPEHRKVGVVFQDYLLFPHLSVLDNVAFGPRSRGLSVADSSVMPVIPRANTNLASMMIGHRAADVITS